MTENTAMDCAFFFLGFIKKGGGDRMKIKTESWCQFVLFNQLFFFLISKPLKFYSSVKQPAP